MNILDMLRQEQSQLEGQIRTLLQSGAHEVKQRQDGLAQCEQALVLQMEAEEGILYPMLRLRMTEEEAEDTLDAYARNYAMADLLRRLMLLAPDDEMWRPSLRVIDAQLVRHHIEQQRTIFEPALDRIEALSLEQMGRHYEALHTQRAQEWSAALGEASGGPFGRSAKDVGASARQARGRSRLSRHPFELRVA